MPASEETRSFSFRAPVIAAAAIVAVYVAYVFIQYGRLNDRNQRELAGAAAELGRSIDNALVTVQNFKQSALDWCAFDQDQPYLKLDQPCSGLINEKPGDVSLSDDNAVAIAVTTDKNKKIFFQFLTGTLLGELSFPESFELIFVAAEDGSILYQDEPAQRQWLRWLRWGERESRDSAADKPGDLRIENLREALSGDKEIEWNRIRSISGRIPLSFGVGYQAYLHPVPISVQTHKKLLLGGAVPTSDLVRQALQVNTYFLALLTVLLMLGLFGFPFVKVIALDKRESFRMPDVYLLYLSSGALLTLLTFVVIGWDTYADWSSKADDGLQSLAKDLGKHFEDEVKNVRDQIDQYDEQISKSWPHQKCVPEVQNNWFGKEDSVIRPQVGKNTYIEQVVWISPAGDQSLKITADKNGTLLKKELIARRPYYRAVRDGNLFTFHDTGRSFFIAPDRSITDGKFKTFFSISSRLDAGACGGGEGEGKYTVAAVIKLLSLDQTPLPAGYGFALFNREGRVLYHSDARVSLRENLFAQTSIGSTLKSRVFASNAATEPAPIAGRYRERPHSFVVLPLGLQRDYSPGGNVMYLTVFRDLSVERAMVAHAFVTSLSVTMLLLTVILIAGMLLAPVAQKGRWGAWLWPHDGVTDLHTRLAVAFLIVLVLGILLVYLTGEPALVLAVPAAAIAAGFVICRSQKWLAKPRATMRSNFWQASEVILLSLCLVVVPSAALFRLALNYEFGKAITTERKWMAEQWADMKLAVAAEGRAEDYPESVAQQRITAREAYLNTCPAPYSKSSEGNVCMESVAAGKDKVHPWSYRLMAVHELLESYLPIESDAMYRSHFANSVYVPIGIIGIRGLCGFAAIIGILLWWIRWNTNGLFHADLDGTLAEPPPGTSEECEAAWQELSWDEKLLLMQVAQEHIANPRQKKMVAHLIRRGLLQLAPDLQPSSEKFAAFLLDKRAGMTQQLKDSHKVSVRQSWRYYRLILIIGLGVLGLFLTATQPGWQSTLLGVATGVTGLLTALLKLQDLVLQWFKPSKS